MAIPFVNATLTAITATGSSGDGYDAPTAGAPRWSGSVGIYVAEEVLEDISDGKVDEIKRTRLEIPYAVGRKVQRGDQVAYTYEDAPVVRTAGTFVRARLVGRVRVLLEDG